MSWTSKCKIMIQMKTIQRLNLSNNKLELIPDVIEKMSSLRHLDVQGNYLRFFPKVNLGLGPLFINK